MTEKVLTATRDVAAPAAAVFELIADPARQPEWDGNDNLLSSTSPRVHGAGEVFVTTLTGAGVRDNHVVEFDEGRRIAWRPATAGEPVAGHLWRWQLEPLGDDRTRVTHTYDWTELTDPDRFVFAERTTTAMLQASVDRLAEVAEREHSVSEEERP